MSLLETYLIKSPEFGTIPNNNNKIKLCFDMDLLSSKNKKMTVRLIMMKLRLPMGDIYDPRFGSSALPVSL